MNNIFEKFVKDFKKPGLARIKKNDSEYMKHYMYPRGMLDILETRDLNW